MLLGDFVDFAARRDENRTAIVEAGVAHFHVGAGIVADSVPEKEWQETLDKAAGILLAAERCGSEGGDETIR